MKEIGKLKGKKCWCKNATVFLISLFISAGCLLFVLTTAYAEQITFHFDFAQPVHAPTSDSHFQYTYDASGNLETETNIASGAVTTYEYNTFNKVERVRKGSEVVLQYLYDPNGTRIAKLDPEGNVLDRYFGPVEENTSQFTRYYMAGSTRAAKRTSNGSLYFFHQDHLGSASNLTNETGTKVLERQYYEFGAIKNEWSQIGDEAHAYTDQRLERETDSYDYNARSYGAKSFRFVTPDSIIPNSTDPQSFNRYAYVRNNPLKYVDPSGHAPEAEGVARLYHGTGAKNLTELRPQGASSSTLLIEVVNGTKDEVSSEVGKVFLSPSYEGAVAMGSWRVHLGEGKQPIVYVVEGSPSDFVEGGTKASGEIWEMTYEGQIGKSGSPRIIGEIGELTTEMASNGRPYPKAPWNEIAVADWKWASEDVIRAEADWVLGGCGPPRTNAGVGPYLDRLSKFAKKSGYRALAKEIQSSARAAGHPVGILGRIGRRMGMRGGRFGGSIIGAGVALLLGSTISHASGYEYSTEQFIYDVINPLPVDVFRPKPKLRDQSPSTFSSPTTIDIIKSSQYAR